MPNENEYIPTNETIARAERIVPDLAEQMRGRRRDALERLDALEKAQKLQYDRVNRWVTYTSVFVAILSASAALWASLEAHWTRVADERPFLSAEVPDPETFIRLHSLGKSPAVKLEAVCFIAPNEQSVDWHRVLNPAKTDQVYRYFALLPGQTEGITCARSQFQGMGEVRYGIVRYEDPEGHTYQTPFCYSQFTHENDKSLDTTVHACIGFAKESPELK